MYVAYTNKHLYYLQAVCMCTNVFIFNGILNISKLLTLDLNFMYQLTWQLAFYSDTGT